MSEPHRHLIEAIRVGVTLIIWQILRGWLADSASNSDWGDIERYLIEAFALGIALWLVAAPIMVWDGRPTMEVRWFQGCLEHTTDVLPLHMESQFVFLTVDVRYREHPWLSWIRTSLLHLEARDLRINLGRSGNVELVIEDDGTGSTGLLTNGLSGLSFRLDPLSSSSSIARPRIEVIAVSEGHFELPVAVELDPSVKVWQRSLVRILTPVKTLVVSADKRYMQGYWGNRQ